MQSNNLCGLILALTLVFSVTACSGNREASTVRDSINTSNSPTPTITNVSPDDKGPIITFETEGVWCNLCAPVKISIFPDGRIIFEGEEYAENKAGNSEEFTKKRTVENRYISESQLAQLIGKFEDMRFFELADRYIPETDKSGVYVPTATCPQSLSDGSTFHIYYRKGSQSKMVHHYNSCEAGENSLKLPDLEKLFDRMFHISAWLKKSRLENINTKPMFSR